MLSYHPQVDVAQLHAFDHHLAQLPGTWTLERALLLASDPHVICPRWILPDARWGDPAGYLAFLDIAAHRVLLRCFMGQTVQKTWCFEELQAHVESQLSAQELQEALTFCELQGFVASHRLSASPISGPPLNGLCRSTFIERIRRWHSVVSSSKNCDNKTWATWMCSRSPSMV